MANINRDQMRKTIAGSLRMERRAHEHTQRTLADAIGVNESTVNAWEGMGGSVRLDDAWAIADVYGITIDQLAGRS